MLTVMIVPKRSDQDHREPWESAGVTEPYVDYVTEDLAAFLGSLVLAEAAVPVG